MAQRGVRAPGRILAERFLTNGGIPARRVEFESAVPDRRIVDAIEVAVQGPPAYRSISRSIRGLAHRAPTPRDVLGANLVLVECLGPDGDVELADGVLGEGVGPHRNVPSTGRVFQQCRVAYRRVLEPVGVHTERPRADAGVAVPCH